MNFNYLQCFTSLAETLNFTKTAKKLKIAQPAVSRQIKLLEEQLGSQLFMRDRQKVMLTSSGQKLKQELTPLINHLNRTLSSFQDEVEVIEGPIHFGSFSGVGEKIFIPLINQFKLQYPKIEFYVRFLKTHEILERLHSGSLDFGIIPDLLLLENIRQYEILKEESVLVTREQNHHQFTSFKDVEIVGYGEDDPLLLSYLKTYHPQFHISKINYALTVNSHTSMVDTLLAHDYYAVLPKLSIKQELSSGKLKTVSSNKLNSLLYLAHQENPYMEKRKVLFRNFLLSELKNRKN